MISFFILWSTLLIFWRSVSMYPSRSTIFLWTPSKSGAEKDFRLTGSRLRAALDRFISSVYLSIILRRPSSSSPWLEMSLSLPLTRSRVSSNSVLETLSSTSLSALVASILSNSSLSKVFVKLPADAQKLFKLVMLFSHLVTLASVIVSLTFVCTMLSEVCTLNFSRFSIWFFWMSLSITNWSTRLFQNVGSELHVGFELAHRLFAL
mmetsp:Transcript_8117/g.9213  ORF Transcript_8117/g.9213 Transcript_8117/m.9213 type:complete len:207 (+) Transcript_8117:559-1179(+)